MRIEIVAALIAIIPASAAIIISLIPPGPDPIVVKNKQFEMGESQLIIDGNYRFLVMPYDGEKSKFRAIIDNKNQDVTCNVNDQGARERCDFNNLTRRQRVEFSLDGTDYVLHVSDIEAGSTRVAAANVEIRRFED